LQKSEVLLSQENFSEKNAENNTLSSPNRNIYILDYEKLAAINKKKSNCGVNFKSYYSVEKKEFVEFPVYCDNRSCCNCKDHKRYKFNKVHQKQIVALNKSMIKPRAWIFTGWVLPNTELTREFCQEKLLQLFHILKQFKTSEFSIHMEIKPKNSEQLYLHFHVVSSYIKNIRLVSKLWSRKVLNEEAIKPKDLGFYVSKYASKVPVFYTNFQENYYTLLVYKLKMNLFSPKANVGEFIPTSKYYSEDQLRVEIYYAYRRGYYNEYGTQIDYHPFLENYLHKIDKEQIKLEVGDECSDGTCCKALQGQVFAFKKKFL
jgi:hypothetical protein